MTVVCEFCPWYDFGHGVAGYSVVIAEVELYALFVFFYDFIRFQFPALFL